MRIYTLSYRGRDWIAAKVGEEYISLQLAYKERLLQTGACAGVRAAESLAATLIPHDLVQLIEMGEKGRAACEEAVAFAGAQRSGDLSGNLDAGWLLPSDQVFIEAPVKTPRKFLCIGLNYREHARESGAAIPKEPVFFNKFATSITSPYGQVVHQGPSVTAKLDYEVELGVVIGRRAKNVAVDEAEKYIFGYTVVNDISARDLQHSDGQWVKGKALDTYAPMGPCVVTSDEIERPGQLSLQLEVNGEVRQNSDTSELIFSPPDLIAYLSRLMTLEPGDIISTGTPSGVGGASDPPRFLSPGDVVRAEIEGIGHLQNKVVSSGV